MTSRETNELLIQVVLAHVPLAIAKRLFADLRNVPGNKSFTDSVKRLDEALAVMPGTRLLDHPDQPIYADADHVVRTDGKSVIIHRVADGAEQRPNGYLLGANMTEMR